MGRLTLLLLAVLAAAPTLAGPRAASLGLCTDELLLMLAPPEQIASVSFLGADPEETRLARYAAGIPTNDGSLESALAHRPELIVTGGTVNSRAHALARRIGVPVVDLPAPTSIDDLLKNIRVLGYALNREDEAERTIRWMYEHLGAPSEDLVSALKVDAGGIAGFANGISAELLRHAGIQLIAWPTMRVGREQLLLSAPELYVRSRYRSDQHSRAASWSPPEAGNATVWLDGRSWTCPGPLAAIDIARIRRELVEKK